MRRERAPHSHEHLPRLLPQPGCGAAGRLFHLRVPLQEGDRHPRRVAHDDAPRSTYTWVQPDENQPGTRVGSQPR